MIRGEIEVNEGFLRDFLSLYSATVLVHNHFDP
jgi:hypothetical protein